MSVTQITQISPAPVQPGNLFGQIITKGMVERAVVASLNVWMDTYLGQLERIETDAAGNPAWPTNGIERPRGIITHAEFEKWPEDQLPVIVVMVPNLAGAPERHADGNYRAQWVTAIAALVSAGDPHGDGTDATLRLAAAYGAAIRLAVLQHKMLKSPLYPAGFATGVTWQDEGYTDVPAESDRSLAAARVTFNVAVDNVATEYAGPRQPLIPAAVDPGNWPAAQFPSPSVTPIGIEDTP